MNVCFCNSGGHNFLKIMEKSDKTNLCVFYWKLQGQCWFNWGLGSRALHRGIKIVATRRIFSWKFQFNQYESYIFESKMAENPQGLFLQWAQIILKQPLIVILWLWKCWNIWKKKNQCSWESLFQINVRQWHFWSSLGANLFLHQ